MVDQPEPKPQSVLLVRFADVGSVIFEATMENVIPYQILALAKYLEIKAQAVIIEAEKPRLDIAPSIPQDYPGLFTGRR